MAWGAIASGLISAFGANKASDAAKASAAQQYEYNLSLQKQNQEWQERMSNTAHQREMADLRAAGLNPLLTVMGGSGASSPTGGISSVGQDTTGAIQQQMYQAMARNALESELIKAQIEKTEKETESIGGQPTTILGGILDDLTKNGGKGTREKIFNIASAIFGNGETQNQWLERTHNKSSIKENIKNKFNRFKLSAEKTNKDFDDSIDKEIRRRYNVR